MIDRASRQVRPHFTPRGVIAPAHLEKFTQCACLLLERGTHLRRIEELLVGHFPLDGIRHLRGGPSAWMMGTQELRVHLSGDADFNPLRPEGPAAIGHVAIDVIDHRWPDAMGDRQQYPELFHAWQSGCFGPLTYPGNLQRAVQQAWGFPEAYSRVQRHCAVVRLRAAWTGEPTLQQRDPLTELRLITDIACVLLREMPEALCYFNPAGEVLMDPATFYEHVERACGDLAFPLQLFVHPRALVYPEQWGLLDVVGMGQFGAIDHEVVFPADRFAVREAMGLAWSAAMESASEPMATPAAANAVALPAPRPGPGSGLWHAVHRPLGAAQPPRAVIRWSAASGRPIPDFLTARIPDDPSPHFSARIKPIIELDPGPELLILMEDE